MKVEESGAPEEAINRQLFLLENHAQAISIGTASVTKYILLFFNPV